MVEEIKFCYSSSIASLPSLISNFLSPVHCSDFMLYNHIHLFTMTVVSIHLFMYVYPVSIQLLMH